MIYDDWGVPQIPTRLDMNFHGLDNINNFTGYTFDEVLHIYYAINRFYDPNTRRFISEDPIRDGHNWYGYCGNNPITRIDPLGLFAEISLDTLYIHLERLKSVAQQSTSIIHEQNHMITGFMRYPQYGGIPWIGTAGPINDRFLRNVRALEPMTYRVLARRNLHLRDGQNNLIDLKHLFATLGAQSNPMPSFRYAAGIAGDFATHIATIAFTAETIFGKAMEYFDIFVCQNRENAFSSLFPYADLFANIDAVNIHALSASNENIVDTVKAYYNNTRPINSARYRFTAFYYNIVGIPMPENIRNANVNVTKLEERLQTVLASTWQLRSLNSNYSADDALIGAKALAWIITAEARNEKR